MVSVRNDIKTNCIIWADDLLLLSECETGLSQILAKLQVYCQENLLTINYEKTKCMIFNKTGKLIHTAFYIGMRKLENVRSYKYLGIIFTPSGEIKSALEDLRCRALKAYWSLRRKLGKYFNLHHPHFLQMI